MIGYAYPCVVMFTLLILLNQLMGFQETLYGYHVTRVHQTLAFFSFLPSVIPKWRPYELVRQERH
jgi:hypothetical protein